MGPGDQPDTHDNSPSKLSQMNFAFASQLQIKQQMDRTFNQFAEIKRRNPNKYIKNPTKVHYMTLGSKDFAF